MEQRKVTTDYATLRPRWGASANARVKDLEKVYTFRQREMVITVLSEFPFLISLVEETYLRIQEFFPGTTIFLEPFIDPDNEGHDPADMELVASIATELEPREVFERFNEFRQTWWLDALDRAQDRLCVKIGF